MSKRVNITVIETLPMAIEGLTGILSKTELHFRLSFAESLDEAEMIGLKNKSRLFIVNPSFFYGNQKLFNLTKSKHDRGKWIGLVFGYHNPELLFLFDALITAADTPQKVESIIKKLLSEDNDEENNLMQDILSGREIDVLQLLATGLSNKEIADKLNISIHTVISHRKNISQKTGIKTVSGLTIYAVTQNLISIDTLKE